MRPDCVMNACALLVDACAYSEVCLYKSHMLSPDPTSFSLHACNLVRFACTKSCMLSPDRHTDRHNIVSLVKFVPPDPDASDS